MRLEKIILVLLASLLLTNCANRSHTGAVLGSTTTTGTCVSMGVENPYAVAGCAVADCAGGAARAPCRSGFARFSSVRGRLDYT